MTALYVIADQYLALAEKLAEGDFDLQTIEDTIEASGITDELAIKAQGCEFIARGALAHHDAIDAEIARLTALKASRDKAAQAMRDYIKTCMERAGIEKIECPLFKLTIKKNPAAVALGRRSGVNLTAKQRQARAKRAGLARWAKARKAAHA